MGDPNELNHLIPDSASYACIEYSYLNINSYSDVVDELLKYIQQLTNNYKVHLLGYSLGGRLAYSLFCIGSNCLKSTTLISSGLPIDSAKDRYLKKQFESMAIQKATLLSAKEFCYWWYSLPIYGQLKSHVNFEDFISKRSKLFHLNHFKTCIQQLSVLNMPINSQSSIIQSSPLTYIYGELDQKYKSIAHKISNYYKVNITCINGAGHLCWYESEIQPLIY